MSQRMIANLDHRRRGIRSGFFSRAALAIENFIRCMYLSETEAANHCRSSFGGMLEKIGEGDDEALRHWRVIEKFLVLPRPSSRGSAQCDEICDRNTIVSALGTQYWANRTRGDQQ
jgi:hypothetical protein